LKLAGLVGEMHIKNVKEKHWWK